MPPRAKKAPTRKRAPRVRLEVDERRAQLLALGRRIFTASPYDEVSMDAVAREAGISKGLVYHYFPTKRDYYVSTIRDAAAELLALTEPPESLPPLERITAGLDAYLAYVERHAAAYASLFRGGVGADPEVFAVVERTREQLLGRILLGAERGLELAKVPAFRLAVRGWVGFVEAVSLDWLERRSLPRADVVTLCVRVLLATVECVAPVD